MSKHRLNDSERELWVSNHEGLYRAWKASRQSMRAFVRANRDMIDSVVKGEP